MSERPILFSGPMIRAILGGRKTQTRRVVDLSEFGPSGTPGYDWTWRGQAPVKSIAQQRRYPGGCWQDVSNDRLMGLCPYGQPGDFLWVREKFQLVRQVAEDWYTAPPTIPIVVPDAGLFEVRYSATYDHDQPKNSACGWRPSIHMPKWAARLWLRITDVRVERLHPMLDADARAEGIRQYVVSGPDPDGRSYQDWVTPFKELWDSINAKRGYSWESNPWVWVVAFERVEASDG